MAVKLVLQVIIGGGGVGERLKPAVLKTVRPERVSGVRIPPPPPASLCFSFSRLFPAQKIEFAAHDEGIYCVAVQSGSLQRGGRGLVGPLFSEAGSRSVFSKDKSPMSSD